MPTAEISDQERRSRELARRARLRYVSDARPGIVRRRSGQGFRYLDPRRGRPVGLRLRQRIEALVIPPAWKDVWICALENGHLQATGTDARGRKQYLYHARWTEVVNRAKFDRLRDVGRCLPALRARVQRDLRERGLTKRRVVAGVVRFLDLTGIRVGSREYLRDNRTYGLTTLENRLVSISGDRIQMAFRGKSGIFQRYELTDRMLARLTRRCRELPGRFVFQYRDDGGIRAVTADDVNAYLAEATRGVMTAKDFRIWRASVYAAARLASAPVETVTLRRIRCVIREAATMLGNTVAVCRKYYIHAGLLRDFESGAYHQQAASTAPRRRRGLSAEERILQDWLEGAD